MPRAKKKVSGKTESSRSGDSGNESLDAWDIQDQDHAVSRKAGTARPGVRKRGWRDIEAIRERARLKTMLADIWHEDIELDDDIFGGSDHLDRYYSESIEEEEVVEIEDSELIDPEDFDETEE